MKLIHNIEDACEALRQGEVLAYPTEAVYGLGVVWNDEAALQKLMELKGRDPSKGLIVVASTIEQLLPLIDAQALSHDEWTKLQSRTARPTTWVVPSSALVSTRLTGGRNTIAVRLIRHATVQAICDELQSAIVSTSANLSAQPPATSWQSVQESFKDTELYILEGSVGTEKNPSTVIDLKTGTVLR